MVVLWWGSVEEPVVVQFATTTADVVEFLLLLFIAAAAVLLFEAAFEVEKLPAVIPVVLFLSFETLRPTWLLIRLLLFACCWFCLLTATAAGAGDWLFYDVYYNYDDVLPWFDVGDDGEGEDEVAPYIIPPFILLDAFY